MSMRPQSPLRLRAIAVVVAVWAMVAVIFGAQQAAVEGSLTWDIVGGVILYDGLWALASIAVLTVIRERPEMIEHALGRRLATHAGMAAVTTLLVLTAYAGLSASVGLTQELDAGRTIRSNLLTGLVTYGLMISAVMTLEQRRTRRERRETQAALERALAAAQAALLRSQLQPHFLFNALNTIAGLIADDPKTAERMAVRLGDFLRLSLETRDAMVPLARELLALEAFLAVQTLRFGDRLRVDLAISPETLSVRVPDLILQPLVENALLHGISPMRSGGRLHIGARCDGRCLELVVADDGAGASLGAMSEGLGLRVTRERLQLLDGTPGSVVDLVTAPGQGFSVTLRLPLQTT